MQSNASGYSLFLALVALAIGTTAACTLEDGPRVDLQPPATRDPGNLASSESGIVVRPARVAVDGSPQRIERLANLPPPPSGPIVSRVVAADVGDRRAARSELSAAAVPPPPPVREAAASTPAPVTASFASPQPQWQVPREVSMDAQPSVRAPVGEATPSQSPANDNVIGVIPFTLQSPNLTDATRKELDEIAKRIVASRLRQVELRAFAMGSEFESRKIALARALVVRSYLLDRGVKARIEVGSFAGDGQDVQILAPKT